MKFSIFNTLKMGISILTVASAAYVQAVQEDASLTIDSSVNLGRQDFQAAIGIIPRWAKEKLKNECFVTRPVVESINDWQFNAIYLKAGIETLAKETAGNELSVITANLSKNASNINDFVQRFFTHPFADDSSFEALDFLISRQNALVIDYTVAYIEQDFELVASLNQELIETNNYIYLFFVKKLYAKNDWLESPDPLQVALATYLDSLILEAQAFAVAIYFETGDFIPVYDAYRASLDSAQEVGRLIGKAVVYTK